MGKRDPPLCQPLPALAAVSYCTQRCGSQAQPCLLAATIRFACGWYSIQAARRARSFLLRVEFEHSAPSSSLKLGPRLALLFHHLSSFVLAFEFSLTNLKQIDMQKAQLRVINNHRVVPKELWSPLGFRGEACNWHFQSPKWFLGWRSPVSIMGERKGQAYPTSGGYALANKDPCIKPTLLLTGRLEAGGGTQIPRGRDRLQTGCCAG